MKKRLIALLLVLILLLPAGLASAATWYRVNTSSLRVHYLPGENTRVLGSYRRDYALNITSSADGWSYVQFSNGFKGYVQTQYLKKSTSYHAWIYRDGTALRKGPDGQSQADFISCIGFRKVAEFADKYLHKGSKIAVTGSIQAGSYTNREGQKVYTTDIIVNTQEFAESRQQGQNNGYQPQGSNYQPQQNQGGYAPQNAPQQAYQPQHQQAPQEQYQQQALPDGFMSIPDSVDDAGLPWN